MTSNSWSSLPALLTANCTGPGGTETVAGSNRDSRAWSATTPAGTGVAGRAEGAAPPHATTMAASPATRTASAPSLRAAVEPAVIIVVMDIVVAAGQDPRTVTSASHQAWSQEIGSGRR